MNWNVRVNKRAVKSLCRLPENIQERFKALSLELRTTGPVQERWSNYGKIQGAENCHHCHIKKGRPTYVAIWKVTGENSLEVTYVGTHESADYQRFC